MSIIIRNSISSEFDRLNLYCQSFSKNQDSNKQVKILSKIGNALSSIAMITNPERAPMRFEERILHEKVCEIWNSLLDAVEGEDGKQLVHLSKVESLIKKIEDLFNFNLFGVLQSIPYDAQLHCFSYLSVVDVCSLSLTSKAGHKIAMDEAIWNDFCQQVGIQLDPYNQKESSYKIFKEAQLNFFYYLFKSVCKDTEIEKSKLMPLLLRELKCINPKEISDESTVIGKLMSNSNLFIRRLIDKPELRILTHVTWNWIWEKLKKIDTIDINYTALSDLPHAMKHLKVKRLDLGNNKFTKFPSHLNIENLNSFQMSDNLLTEFPLSLLQAHALRYLDLSNNPIGKLPKGIDALGELRWLNVSDAGLKEVPETLWKLTKLVKLKLNNNYITELSESVGKLTSLIELKLNDNNLNSLPDSLWTLQGEVQLQRNPIKTFPNSIEIPFSRDLRITIDDPPDIKRNLQFLGNQVRYCHVEAPAPPLRFACMISPPKLESSVPPHISDKAASIIESESKHRSEDS